MIPYLVLGLAVAFVLGSVLGVGALLHSFSRSVLFRREPKRWEVVE